MPLWVEIVNCDYETSWYYDHIGLTVEVKDRPDGYYEVIDHSPDKQFKRFLIDKRHVKIIE